MGVSFHTDTGEVAFEGAYSRFNGYRGALSKAAGIPWELMEGIERLTPYLGSLDDMAPKYTRSYGLRSPLLAAGDWLPISWDVLRPDDIHLILCQSDTDGSIKGVRRIERLRTRMEELLPKIEEVDRLSHELRIQQGQNLRALAEAIPGTVVFTGTDRLPLTLEMSPDEIAMLIEQHGYGIEWPEDAKGWAMKDLEHWPEWLQPWGKAYDHHDELHLPVWASRGMSWADTTRQFIIATTGARLLTWG